MKKLTLSLFLLALCVMAGCSSQTAGGPAASDAEQSKTEITAEPAEKPAPEPAKIKLSATELVQKFEENYNSCGASGLMTDGQLGAELDALRSLASTNNIELPSDYEQQYRDWREPLVTEKVDELHQAYMDYLTGRSLMDEDDYLTWYADYVDFDADGWDELLVVKWLSYSSSIYYAEIVAPVDGNIQTIGTLKNETPVDFVTLTLCKKAEQGDNRIYLYWNSSVRNGVFFNKVDYFYTVENSSITFADKIDVMLYHAVENNIRIDRAEYYDGNAESNISEEQYELIKAKYEDISQIASSETIGQLGHGILADYMNVSLTEDDRQYRTNLFLSNFSEQFFGSFNRNDIDIGQLVEFVHRFADINSPGNLTIIDDGIEWPKVSFSLDYFNKVTMRFFGRSFSSDEVSHATLNNDVFDDYRFQNNTFYGEMIDHGAAAFTFSVVRQIYRLNNNTYWIEYSIFGSEKVDSEFMKQCYKMDYSKASNSPDLYDYSPYHSSGGVAIVEVSGSGSEETYHLLSYSGW